MKISLENCNSLDVGEIEIKENHLNIKYAVNGTGKSTIAAAIKAAAENNEKDLENLLPFKYYSERDFKSVADVNKTRVQIMEGSHKKEISSMIKRIHVFNEEYVSKYLFEKDQVISNTNAFEVFVKTPRYEDKMKEINNLIKSISEMFQDKTELQDVIMMFNEFLGKIVKQGKTKISATGSLHKALAAQGNKTVNIPSEFKKYEKFILGDKAGAWANWQSTGKEYLEDQQTDITCPYCAHDIESPQQTSIIELSKEFSSEYLVNLKKVLDAFSVIKEFFDGATQLQIDKIGSSAVAFSKDEEFFIKQIYFEIEMLKSRLETAQQLKYDFLKEQADITKFLDDCKIRLANYPRLKSNKTQQIVNDLNDSLDAVIVKVLDLQKAIKEEKLIVGETVRKNEDGINKFLENAGYPYAVSIKEEYPGKYQTILKYVNGDVVVPKIKEQLSFGEMNAFALAVFMYDALSKNADFIVLDDPVSSFDKQKKFAIMNMLFCQDEVTFRGITTLLLTHDFEPIVDMLKIHGEQFCWKESDGKGKKQFVKAWFMRNQIDNASKKSRLIEVPVYNKNILNYFQVLDYNCTHANSKISRLIYLRRLKELENNKDNVWNMLSSMFHKGCEIPKTRDESGNYFNMEANEICEAEQQIASKIDSTFAYAEDYADLWKESKLFELFDGCECGYEKLQLFRCMNELFGYNAGSIEEKIFMKFINETYHAEMDYIFQLDPREFEIVPAHILSMCNARVEAYKVASSLKSE